VRRPDLYQRPVNGEVAPEAVMGWQPAGVDVAPGSGHGGHSMNCITASALGVNEGIRSAILCQHCQKSPRGSLQLADMRFAGETVDNQSN
jgi:hypothetical protein